MNLVNYLEEQNLKASFFIIGSRAVSRPDMVQSEYVLGHQIGGHTWCAHVPGGHGGAAR